MDKWPPPAQTEINSNDIYSPQYADVPQHAEVQGTTHLVTLTLSVGAKNSHGAEPSILVSDRYSFNLSMHQV